MLLHNVLQPTLYAAPAPPALLEPFQALCVLPIPTLPVHLAPLAWLAAHTRQVPVQPLQMLFAQHVLPAWLAAPTRQLLAPPLPTQYATPVPPALLATMLAPPAQLPPTRSAAPVPLALQVQHINPLLAPVWSIQCVLPAQYVWLAARTGHLLAMLLPTRHVQPALYAQQGPMSVLLALPLPTQSALPVPPVLLAATLPLHVAV